MTGNSGKHTESDAEKFWKEIEDTLKQKVLARSMGQYLSGYEDWGRLYWGIFFITESALHFRHFKQENWYTAVLNAASKGLGDEDREFSIPRTSISRIIRRSPRSAFMRFLLQTDPEAIIVYQTAEDQPRNLHIRIEQDPNTFYAELDRG